MFKDDQMLNLELLKQLLVSFQISKIPVVSLIDDYEKTEVTE